MFTLLDMISAFFVFVRSKARLNLIIISISSIEMNTVVLWLRHLDREVRILTGPWPNILGKDIYHYFLLVGLMSVTVTRRGLKKGTCFCLLQAIFVVKESKVKNTK